MKKIRKKMLAVVLSLVLIVPMAGEMRQVRAEAETEMESTVEESSEAVSQEESTTEIVVTQGGVEETQATVETDEIETEEGMGVTGDEIEVDIISETEPESESELIVNMFSTNMPEDRSFLSYCNVPFLSTVKDGEPITEEEVLTFADSIYIEYQFDFTELMKKGELSQGDTFSFYIPSVLRVTMDESGYDYVVENEKVAHVSVDTTATELGYFAKMTVLSLGTDEWDWSGKGNLWLASTLDKEAVYDAIEEWDSVDGKIEIDLGKGDTVTVVIDAAVTPDLLTEKKGELSLADRQATWSITVHPNNEEGVSGLYLYQVKLYDTIQVGQEYVQNSLQISTDQENWTLVDSQFVTYTDKVLSIDLSALLGDQAHNGGILADGSKTYYLQYVTDVDCGVGEEYTYQLTKDNKITLQNTMTGSYQYKETIAEEGLTDGSDSVKGTAQAVLDESVYLLKIADTTDTSKLNPEITWTIKVNQGGMDLSRAVMIKDTLPKGINKIKNDEIRVYINDEELDPIILTAADYTLGEDGRTSFQIDLADALSRAINCPVTLVYETDVDWEEANFSNGITYTNDVTMSVGGENPWLVIRKSATGTIADGVVLSKTAMGYNPKTHEFSWKIVARNYVNEKILPDFSIYDVLPDGHDFVSGSYTSTEGESATCSGKVTEHGILLLTEKDVKEQREYVFTVVTKWNDEHIAAWAGNLTDRNTNVSTNTAVMMPEELEEESQLASAYEVRATQKYTSQMLAKTFNGYNYDTHIVTWKLTMNHNQLAIYNGVVVEQIPAGQSIVEESLKSLVEKELIHSYTIKGQEVYLYITEPNKNECFTDKRVLTIQTEVTDQKALQSNGNYVVTNHAILQGEVMSSQGILLSLPDITADANNKIVTEILTKTGKKPNENDSFITWTVDINKNKVKTEHLLLDDTLPDGVTLDLDSISLVGLAIAWDGTKSIDDSMKVPSYKISQKDNVFTIEFTETVEHAYRLTYITRIDEEKVHADVTNTIVIRGGDVHTQGSTSDKIDIYYTAMGGSTGAQIKPPASGEEDTDDNRDNTGDSDSNEDTDSDTRTVNTLIQEEEVPLASIIPDEEVPLAQGLEDAHGLLDANGLLPQTGGFWGSGMMYILGAILLAAGAVMLFFTRKKKQDTISNAER